jgi:hypothetical protein
MDYPIRFSFKVDIDGNALYSGRGSNTSPQPFGCGGVIH